ncbi:MAG: lipoyl(octanoyl) transferase LipB [Desulfovibrionaceae bacterium]
MKVVDLGRIGYAEAEALQMERLADVAVGGEETLFLLEHDPVITLGRHAGREHLHVSDDYLREAGITLARAARGGDITCHFPGQLVAYPIVRLAHRPGGIRAMFHDLEEAAIKTLAHFAIAATRDPDRPGVWVGPRKIASVGIGVRKWVSFHGIALNVGRDLSLFDCITLCGLADTHPTSIHIESGNDAVTMHEVKDVFARAFQAVAHSAMAAHQAAAQ